MNYRLDPRAFYERAVVYYRLVSSSSVGNGNVLIVTMK